MYWLKNLVKLAGIVGVRIGGYELGDCFANGKAAETIKTVGREIEMLKIALVQQNADAQDNFESIQLTTLGIVGGIILAFIVGFAVWVIKSTKSCITKSVESAVEAPPSK